MSWQYLKINLNELPRRADEMDVLCKAGEEGWELTTVLPNNVAYLKREYDADVRAGEAPAADHEEVRSSEVKAKYRDAATGDAWSGRGRMAMWLKRKQDAGEDIEKYRV